MGQRIVPTGPAGPFKLLADAPGEGYLTREDGVASALPGRASRRSSLLYFGQLTDFQLADEESPARVEFLDQTHSALGAAFRPWEALMPQTINAGIQGVNQWSDAGPVQDGRGNRPRMDFAMTTGDSADNMQRNETQWVVRLLDGGQLDPNSGISDTSKYDSFCQGLVAANQLDPNEASHYTGVQDFNDYNEGPSPVFYDPNKPSPDPNNPPDPYGKWPAYPGLMDRAEKPFTATGVRYGNGQRVPTYAVFGNHDGLAQGNQAANGGFETVATGCLKAFAPLGGPNTLQGQLAALTPANVLAGLTSNPQRSFPVPPDPRRQYVSKAQYKKIYDDGVQADGHGFKLVDSAELAASHGAAGYYSWSPKPGLRFIGLDTVSEGGVTGPSSDGNLDDPQFRWLERQLQAATVRNELIVLFSHHAIPSLVANVPDEAAPPCTGQQKAPPPGESGPSHDTNPGCDVDPRNSQPLHLGGDPAHPPVPPGPSGGETLLALLHRYPHVIAWVAGHSHINDVQPFPAAGGGGFWSIRLAAEADWPQQNRLLQIMDNKDGTLSIFGTILDHLSPAAAPAAGSNASVFTNTQLASLARTMAFNDPDTGYNTSDGVRNKGSDASGRPADRNVELMVDDPRTPVIHGTSGNDRIFGTAGRDVIFCGAGNDIVFAGGGNDEIHCDGGNDVVFGGPGNDFITGGSGKDRLFGGT
ncbi:MAG: hypothetical protein LC792_23395, partial [Actinobacteria bacterium]|nr:hypothetical protein [Actinomycetota bacterium]